MGRSAMTPDAPMSRNHIVGRVDELSRIDAFLDGLGEGPAALVLEGGSGMGKTTLWDRGVVGAAGRGWRVLSIRPAESEATLAFAGLADLFEGTRDLVERLPAPQLAALEVALLRAEPVGPPPDPRAVYAAALTVLREAATQGPVLIAIDDVQWLDGSTAGALAFALRRLTDEPIGWLLAVRGSASTLPLGIGRALPDERVGRLSIEPLSVDELAELVRARLGTSFPPAILHAMHETSGGNPFFALEIARATLRGDTRATGQALPIPRNLRDDLVRDRVGTLAVVRAGAAPLRLGVCASHRGAVGGGPRTFTARRAARGRRRRGHRGARRRVGRVRASHLPLGDLCRQLTGAPPSGPPPAERGGGRRRGARPASGVGGGRSGRGRRVGSGGRGADGRATADPPRPRLSSASWRSGSRRPTGSPTCAACAARPPSTGCSPATTTRRSRSSSPSWPSLRRGRIWRRRSSGWDAPS